MARRLPPPLTVKEGSQTTAPMSGVQELIDNQLEELYSQEATATFGTPDIPPRVQTSRDGRQKSAAPVLLEEEQPNTKNVVSNTLTTCLNACGGAMYDIWHWPQLPGSTPSRIRTVVTRGGRGPYLLLTFVVLLFVVFAVVYCIRSMRRQPSSMHGSRAVTKNTSIRVGPPILPGATKSQAQVVQPSVQPSAPVLETPAMAPTTNYRFA